jgi:preprotein translocase subunit SecE
MASKEVAMTNRTMVSELFSSVIYKPNQGRMVRQVTALSIWAVSVLGAWRFHSTVLLGYFGSNAAGYLIAAAIAAVGVWVGFRLVNWPRFADFLISVEAELNKVSWPSWRELNRASLVVIFTIFFLAAILFVYDFIWQFVFTTLKI